MIFIVKQNELVPVETFGRFSRMAKPGLNIKLPYPIQDKGRPLHTCALAINPKLFIKTIDGFLVEIPMMLEYQVIMEKAFDAYYSLKNPQDQIASFVLNAVRISVGKMSMNEMESQRNQIKEGVSSLVGEQLNSYGYKILRLSIGIQMDTRHAYLVEILKSFKNAEQLNQFVESKGGIDALDITDFEKSVFRFVLNVAQEDEDIEAMSDEEEIGVRILRRVFGLAKKHNTELARFLTTH